MRTVKIEELETVETVSPTDEVLALSNNNLVRTPVGQFVQAVDINACTSCVQTFATQDLPTAPEVGTLAFDITREKLVYFKADGWYFVGDDSPCDEYSTSSPSSSLSSSIGSSISSSSVSSPSSISSSSISLSSSSGSSISSSDVSSPSSISSSSTSLSSSSGSSISSSDVSSPSSISSSSHSLSSSDSFTFMPWPLNPPITAQNSAGTYVYVGQTEFEDYFRSIPTTERAAGTYRYWNHPFHKFKDDILVHLRIGTSYYYTEGYINPVGGGIHHGLVDYNGNPIPFPPSGLPSGSLVELLGTTYAGLPISYPATMVKINNGPNELYIDFSEGHPYRQLVVSTNNTGTGITVSNFVVTIHAVNLNQMKVALDADAPPFVTYTLKDGTNLGALVGGMTYNLL